MIYRIGTSLCARYKYEDDSYENPNQNATKQLGSRSAIGQQTRLALFHRSSLRCSRETQRN